MVGDFDDSLAALKATGEVKMEYRQICLKQGGARWAQWSRSALHSRIPKAWRSGRMVGMHVLCSCALAGGACKRHLAV